MPSRIPPWIPLRFRGERMVARIARLTETDKGVRIHTGVTTYTSREVMSPHVSSRPHALSQYLRQHIFREPVLIMEEMLIEKVRSRPFLYDAKSGDYRDQEMRTNAWEEIGKELKIKPGIAKDTWEKLRRCFMNALSRRRNKKSGDGATKMPPWKFEQEMSFILPSFSTRRTQSNLQEGDELREEVVETETSTNHRSGDDINAFNSEVPSSQDTPQIQQEDHIASSNVPYEKHVNSQNIGIKRKKRDEGDNSIYQMVKIMRENSTLRRIRHEEKKISSLDLDDTDMFFLSLAKTAKTLPPLELAKVKLQVSQAVLQTQIAVGEQAKYRQSSASPASHNSTYIETSFSPRPISTESAASCSSGTGVYTMPLGNDPINSEYLGPQVGSTLRGTCIRCSETSWFILQAGSLHWSSCMTSATAVLLECGRSQTSLPEAVNG
uniref:MADF domain-containing protein n=1 Tax=Timema tahoe TaxID=61484 RepID=A0A7R9IFK9_9NEOP|nr:unnamed protein product [Timema tahoe]